MPNCYIRAERMMHLEGLAHSEHMINPLMHMSGILAEDTRQLPFQDGFTAELSRERDELKVKLESCKAALRDADSKLENSKEDNKQLQYRLERLDEKLDAKDRYGTASLRICVVEYLIRGRND